MNVNNNAAVAIEGNAAAAAAAPAGDITDFTAFDMIVITDGAINYLCTKENLSIMNGMNNTDWEYEGPHNMTRLQGIMYNGELKATSSININDLRKFLVVLKFNKDFYSQLKRPAICDAIIGRRDAYDTMLLTDDDPQNLRVLFATTLETVQGIIVVPQDYQGSTLDFCKEYVTGEMDKSNQYNKVEEKWFQKFKGWCSVPPGQKPPSTIGSWVTTQRDSYKKLFRIDKTNKAGDVITNGNSALTHQQYHLLNLVEFDFVSSHEKKRQAGNERFHTFVREFLEVMLEFGDGVLPSVYPPHQKVADERKYFLKQHAKGELSAKQVEMLTDIGALEDPSEADAMRRAEEFIILFDEYRTTSGNDHLPWPRHIPPKFKAMSKTIWPLIMYIRGKRGSRSDESLGVDMNEMGGVELSAAEKHIIAHLDTVGFDFFPIKHYAEKDRIEWAFATFLRNYKDSTGRHRFTQSLFDEKLLREDARRPDGEISFGVRIEGEMKYGAIIPCIDEHRHDGDSKQKQQRWETFIVWATRVHLEYDFVYLVRINVAERYEPLHPQMSFVFELFDSIIDSPKMGSHWIAVDYPHRHPHVKASCRMKIPEGLEEYVGMVENANDYKRPRYNSVASYRSPITDNQR